MLQNGVIPCRIVDTPTHLRYYVNEEDLKKYLAKSPSERSREIPVGVFSSRKENSLPLYMGGRDNNVNIVLTSDERVMFIRLLEKRMEIYPDAMDINRVAQITGYSRTTILRRVQNGDIFAVMMNDEYVLMASKADIFATVDVKDEDGNSRRCSRGDYVRAEIESGRDIEVITIEDLLSLLGTSREELESMPELDAEYLLDDKYKKQK